MELKIISGLFEAGQLEKLQGACDRLLFEDGARSAGLLAKQVKHNMQAKPSPALSLIQQKFDQALMQNNQLKYFAFPKYITKALISHSKKGDYYGLHSDNAINGVCLPAS